MKAIGGISVVLCVLLSCSSIEEPDYSKLTRELEKNIDLFNHMNFHTRRGGLGLTIRKRDTLHFDPRLPADQNDSLVYITAVIYNKQQKNVSITEQTRQYSERNNNPSIRVGEQNRSGTLSEGKNK